MFGMQTQRRKLTTYGKSARQPAYTLMQDGSSPEKSKSINATLQAEEKKPPGKESNRRVATEVLARPPPKQSEDVGWDVPSSDEESRRRGGLFQSQRMTPQRPKTSKTAGAVNLEMDSNRSPRAVLDTDQTCKRHLSASRTARAPRQKSVPPLSAPAGILHKRPAPQILSSQPSRKRQRTPSKASPSVNTISNRSRGDTTMPDGEGLVQAKSRRLGRSQGSSVLSTRKMDQSSSAPATLFGMIRASPSPSANLSESPTFPSTPNLTLEKNTDTEPTTPPTHTLASPGSGLRSSSVTPRQKQLWGKLLGSDTIDGPSDLRDLSSISKLHISGASNRKLLMLSRSSSDVPQTTHSRHMRLIDGLKASAPVEEEDEEINDTEELDNIGREPANSLKAAFKVNEFTQHVEIPTTTTIKVTYSQQRSYLEPQNEQAAFDELVEEFSQSTAQHDSQSQGVDVEEEDDSQQGLARGFHDLRVAGSNLRLSDMFGDILSDIEGTSTTLAIRRSALMELATKLMDPAAATYFLDRGFDGRFIKSIGKTVDVISNFIAAAAVATLAAHGAGLNALLNILRSKWYIQLIGLLDVDVGLEKIVRERRNNLSKMAQISTLEFAHAVLRFNIWEGTSIKALSPYLMTLKCIELLVRKVREHGSHEALVDERTIRLLLAIASAHVDEDPPKLAAAELVLSILESSTTTSATQHKQSGWSSDLVKSVALILPSVVSTSSPVTSQRCGDLALRLSLNLTNDNPLACVMFGKASTIQPLIAAINHLFDVLNVGANMETRIMTLDRLTLCLGVMINLAEFSEEVRCAVIEGTNSLLDQSVQLFLAGRERTCQADSIEAMQANVPYGYLAILLGNLCQNGRIKSRVQKELPGGNLGLLVDAVDEFTKIYQMADRDMFDGDEGQEVYSNFGARLQIVLDNLRRAAATT